MDSSRHAAGLPGRCLRAARIAAALVGVILSGLYLLNLTCGLVELPDNLPLVGNIDEVAVSALLFGCLRYLGIDVVPFRRETGKHV